MTRATTTGRRPRLLRRLGWLLLSGLLGLLLSQGLPLGASTLTQNTLLTQNPPAPAEASALTTAGTGSAADGGPAEGGVATCRMGVYIEDLRDFSFAEKSLFASLRVWSVCPSASLTPLADLEFTNANEVTIGEVKTRFEPNRSRAFPGKSGLYWSELGASGSFYYPWSARNFPFDRHHIQFDIVPRGVHQSGFLITPDFQNSGFSPHISSGDWITSDFQISERQIDQGSSFGNPAAAGGNSQGLSAISASIEVRRARITSFLKMCAGVYAAAAISAMAFYMDPREPDLVSGRTGLCVGCLFAAIVNMQQAESTLGISEDVTLTDQIHIIAILYILISTILAIVSYLRCERDEADRAQQLDRKLYLPIFSISYVVMNIVIISYAILVG